MPTLFLEILIPIVILLLAVGFFVSAYVLYLVTNKIFKIQKASYKSSLLISLWLLIVGLIAGIVLWGILKLLGFLFLLELLSAILGFVLFHFLLQKYYQTSLKNNLLIYILYSVITGIVAVIVSLIIILPLRTSVMEPFYVKGESMSPALAANDYLIINKFDKNYQRGDIIVYRYPKDPNQFLIQRIIGLPGDKVTFAGDKVLINGQILDESKYLSPGQSTQAAGTAEFNLGSDEYFVLGDNRGASLDSRRFGPLTNNLIIGKYWFTAAKANQ